jgi:hypothetical protein
MKRYIVLAITFLTTLLITSCATNTTSQTQIHPELANEYWMQHVNLNPNLWTKNASPWFYNNQPQRLDQFEPYTSPNRATTSMTIRLPFFNALRVEGGFRVQVIGNQPQPGVFIVGPNDQVRHTIVEVKGSTLDVHSAADCGTACGGFDRVIIRVSVRDLNNIQNFGGLVEGKNITSPNLTITNNGGRVLLIGNMVLTNVLEKGGETTVLGAYTPTLCVTNLGNGAINLNGRMNIQKILNEGNGAINILGANSTGLSAQTSGGSLTNVVGYVNLTKLTAIDYSRVYMYWINSGGMYITVTGHAHVGLAGSARNLDVDANYESRFQGKYLHVDNIYVRTRSYSHANVNPGQKLFATAMDDSSIYFFSSPNVVSRYTLSNGIVVPIFTDACPVPFAPRPIYKDEPAPAAAVHNYKDEGGFSR